MAQVVGYETTSHEIYCVDHLPEGEEVRKELRTDTQTDEEYLCLTCLKPLGTWVIGQGSTEA